MTQTPLAITCIHCNAQSTIPYTTFVTDIGNVVYFCSEACYIQEMNSAIRAYVCSQNGLPLDQKENKS